MITEVDKMEEKMKVAQPDLYAANGQSFLKTIRQYAVDHNKTVMEFGRYPHRNAVLGRESTPEEVEYLKTANTYGQ